MSRLEEWSFFAMDSNPYLTPELRTVALQGEIYDDNGRFPDGRCIRTSHVIELNLEENYTITRTGTRYTLGKISQAYLDWLKDNNIELKSFKKKKRSK